MKCKHDNTEMDCIISDEFMEIYLCTKCGSAYILNIEICHNGKWYVEEEEAD